MANIVSYSCKIFVKVLITTFTYPPNADGCAVAAAVLADGLAKRGHSVTVATAAHPDRQSLSDAANPRVVEFRVSGSSNRRIGVHGDIAAYQAFLRQSSFDLIIFETWDTWPTFLAEPLLPQLAAKKIVVSHGYTPHLWTPYPRFPWGLGQWVGGWPLVLRTPRLLRQFDQLVVLSRRQDFGRFFDHRLAQWTGYKKVTVIPNGAHAAEFANPALPDFRREFGLGPGLMLLCVANYCDRKNQMLAVRAFRHAGLKAATLVLVGSEFNEYAEQVRRLDKALQKDFPEGRVMLLEKLTRPQTCAAYNAADLFVLSAKAETQPIVLLEAMASHTPWISTNTGCVSELPGGLVAHSEMDLVKKMRELAASSEQRKKLAAEGWAACQQTYDWEQVVAAYDQLIKTLVPQ
jgi:glycosyltransferase involved in cell wall biosynthesis